MFAADLGIPAPYINASSPRLMLAVSREVQLQGVELTADDAEALAAMFPGAAEVRPTAWDISAPLQVAEPQGAAAGGQQQASCDAALAAALAAALSSGEVQLQAAALTVQAVECTAGEVGAGRRRRALQADGAGVAASGNGSCSLGPESSLAAETATVAVSLRVTAVGQATSNSSSTSGGSSPTSKAAASPRVQAQAGLAAWRAAGAGGLSVCLPGAGSIRVVATQLRAMYQVPLSDLGARAYEGACGAAGAAGGGADMPGLEGGASCQLLPAASSNLRSEVRPLRGGTTTSDCTTVISKRVLPVRSPWRALGHAAAEA